MGKNEVTIMGVKYIAKVSECGCEGCAFEFDILMDDTCRKVECQSEKREDGLDVIFIESPQDETSN